MYDGLRDYQKVIVEKIRQAFRDGHKRVLLYAPCAGGKTEMAISFLDATKNNNRKSAMVLDRNVLVNQTSKRLDKYQIEHGVIQSGHYRYRPSEHIQVCSAQTLEQRGSFPGVSLLVIDECHTQRKKTTEFVKNNPHIHTIGLSGSPFTKGLGATINKLAHSDG